MLKNIVHFYDKIGPEAPEVGKWLILPWLLCSGFLFFEKEKASFGFSVSFTS